ncbi:MAG: hypothetical protein M1829_004112 [Trizodia sp. TS-e1964]|nr:MAG: hypothetical protein M1829_004112 [Trizodia sp. TS-e1964]
MFNPTPRFVATSPPPAPTKRDLTSWWKKFNKTSKKEEEKVEPPSGIFGVPLQESIKYANVAISLTNDDGKSFIYGYVPIVVAKCGVFLKEKATDVEGIFRLSGSAKRIKDLQVIFNSPDRYGKGLDWTGYTVHDAANILRRYLNQLPEPIIPLEFYDRFRDPLRIHSAPIITDSENGEPTVSTFDDEALNTAITVYQQLITQLPPLSRQLLLYILDLLAVFSSKSDENRMTSANLAAIFQPGMLSHPVHDMAPAEYRLSQDVLIFLIENQDHFLLGMRGTAADESTVQEVERGGTPTASVPTTPAQPRSPITKLGRSSSNASAGADSLRKYASVGARRNLSISSKNSGTAGVGPVNSSYIATSGSPTTGSGLQRSNTLPSSKSPAIASDIFSKPHDPAVTYESNNADIVIPDAPQGHQALDWVPSGIPLSNSASSITPTATETLTSAPSAEWGPSREKLLVDAPAPVQGKERGFSNLFSKSPTSDSERKDPRQPNKLRKKRAPGSANQSAQSSTNSLSEDVVMGGTEEHQINNAGSFVPTTTSKPTGTW